MKTSVEHSAAKYDPQENFLVFAVNQQLFALPHQKIISVLDNPASTMMPGMSDHARGVMNFMGEPVTYFDFRKILGEQSIREEINELFDMLLARKQDHLNWVSKLKEAVTNGTEITVQTNPHLCAFGKWYDGFQTENLALSRYLKKFDQPHQKIHALAIQAKGLISAGNAQTALDMIHEAENTVLAQLIRLFDEARDELQRANTEYAIVTQTDDMRKAAFAVDQPKYFGVLDEITHPLPKMVVQQSNGFVEACGTLKVDDTNTEILIIELTKLISR